MIRALAPALAALLLAGCAALQGDALREQPPAGLAPRAELEATPFFPQTAYHCGPAALATALAAAGFDARPEPLGEQVFLPAREGTLQPEMLAGARRAGAVATRLPPTLEALLREVALGRPVVVLQNLGLAALPLWHYAVVVGYDLPGGEVVLRSGVTRREVMSLAVFERTWRRSGMWAFVALPPGQWPATAEPQAVVDASLGYARVATPRDAAAVYRSAIARVGEREPLAIGLGNALHEGGDLRAAAEVFRATALRERSAPAWINLSATLLGLGDRAGALDAAQQALALNQPAWQTRAEAALKAAQEGRHDHGDASL